MALKLATGDTFYRPRRRTPFPPGLAPAARPAFLFTHGRRRDLALIDHPDSHESIQVFVDHGRWVVNCPRCNSAQLAYASDPRFLCAECHNGGVGWLTVEWPERVADIERALMRRPTENRNWQPGETPAALLAENRLHGI